MSEQLLELTSTERPIPAAADTTAAPAPDPRLVSACGVLIEWLLEELQHADEAQPEGDLLAVGEGA